MTTKKAVKQKRPRGRPIIPVYCGYCGVLITEGWQFYVSKHKPECTKKPYRKRKQNAVPDVQPAGGETRP